MDEENFFWSEPLNVDAIVANDGDEYLANADADAQGDENFYGQNQSLAGDSGWWDDNYPGQTVQNPDTVSNTTDYGDYGSPTGAGAAGTSTTVTLDPYSGLTPNQLEQLGDADPTDPYIRARLGIPQLPDSPLTSLPSTSNFFNSIKDVATSATGTVQKALSTLTTRTPAANPYAQTPLVPKSLSALTAKAATPTQDAYGLTILNAAETQQLTRNINPAFINSLTDPNAGTSVPPAEYRQTVVDAARLNRDSEIPNPFLTEIDKSGIVIEQSQATIATARNQIDEADQRRALGESIIQQNNAELADPNITDERRRELTENNLAAAQNIFDQTQNIEQNQTAILQAQDTITLAETNINENAAVYRDTTNPANTTTVDVNTNPNLSLVDRVTNFFSGQPTQLAPVSDAGTSGIRRDPEGSGGFINAAGNPVTADGVEILPVTTTTFVDANVAQLPSAATSTALGNNPDAELDAAAVIQVGRQLAQKQAVLNAQKRIPNNSDWRVRLQLAPGATYLYNAPAPGILWPLRQTNGVVFPYTPKIELNYKADYDSYALTHSNYKGYFYKSSSLDPIGMTATFTAQDTTEAEYLLAVIHFFRSVTKMFYGQDTERGAPPPLVYLTGLGEFQFTQQPCVVASFNYNLPSDVDYIRARSINVQGTDLLTRRQRQNLPTNPISGAVARLQNLFNSQGINKGANFDRPAPPNLGQNQPTYVPTKLDIQLSLFPIQSRQQVSREFSLKQYANGDLLKRGFW